MTRRKAFVPLYFALLLGLGSCSRPSSATPHDAKGPTSTEGPAMHAEQAADLAVEIETRLPPPIEIRGEPHFSRLDKVMKAHQVKGLSIAVFEDDQLVFAKGYGVIDDETNQSIDTRTLFQAASISKSVNALATVLMAEQGKFSLEQPVNDILKSWTLPDTSFTSHQAVTLKHLLTHTGGTTVSGFPGYLRGQSFPTLGQLLDGKKPTNTAPIRVDKVPGQDFRYSGGGISIVQQTLIDVSGMAYPKLLKNVRLNIGRKVDQFL